ncbi:MAG: 16S rRNA pseudouridine(516) synthase [Pseudomonadota bacterium]
MSLERILQSQGFGSRRECRALVQAGRVAVSEAICDDPDCLFDVQALSFSVDGDPWPYEKLLYLALNKPANYECSHKPKHHPSVFSLLPKPFIERGVQSVGRLDEDTTGLLLLTDDGQFIHTYSSPKKKIPKRYVITLKHPADEAQINALLTGVQLHDEPSPIVAAGCVQISEHVIHLTVTEGKYHLVKRMVAATGNRVEALHRSTIGGFELPETLAPGSWMRLSADDLTRLATRLAPAAESA